MQRKLTGRFISGKWLRPFNYINLILFLINVLISSNVTGQEIPTYYYKESKFIDVNYTFLKEGTYNEGLYLPYQIREIPGIKNISFGDAKGQQDEIPMNLNLPANMPNIDPAMIQARMREIMSNPKKMLEAWKRFPMATQMFLNAPLEAKKRIANMFDDNLLEETPDNIKQEIIKIKKGEYVEEEQDFEPKLSISCESGGKQLPLIVQNINDNNLKIKTVNMHEPTLEDVFLHYVGNAIREESSNNTKNIKKFIQMRQLRK